MKQTARDHVVHTIGLAELARHVPELVVDAPGMLRNAVMFLLRPHNTWSLGWVFQQIAHRFPERTFLRFEGRDFRYGDVNAIVNRYASVLSNRHGVGRGDVVGILLTNRPEAMFLVLATVKLGAVAGMLNHHQQGEVLTHSIDLLQGRVLVVGEECRDAVDELDLSPIAVVDAADLHAASQDASDADPEVCSRICAGERAFLIFTSGTTGLPKASVMTHLRWSKSMAGFGGQGVRLHGNDTLYCCLPLYHNNALTVALSSVLAGRATFALGRKFSASRFWDEIVLDRATGFIYVGELCRYLLKQPAKQIERDHRVRMVVGNGLRPELWDEFRERFGVGRIVEFYGMSEAPLAFLNVFNIDKTAGVGAYSYAIVDYDTVTGHAARNGCGRLRRVGRGRVGLLLAKVTGRAPFDGYTDDQAGERKLVRDAFRAGDVWFDTGDLVLDQGHHHIAFVDRLGDTFRWKGENVATTEVERAIVAGNDIIDAAVAYGVAIPGTDGKAGMAAVTLRPDVVFDGVGLARRLADRLPSYAIPLFVRVVDGLEHTSTFKSRKVELRECGYSEDAPGRLYVFAGPAEGYVGTYPDYVTEVADGKRPRPGS